MSLVDKRYAEALVDISVHKNKVQTYQEELKSIVNIYNSQLDLKLLFLNPQVKVEVKKEIADKVFRNQIETDLLNFIKLLIDKGRIKFLPTIAEEFYKLADKNKNVLNMTIITTTPLGETQVNSLKEKYRILYNAMSVKVSMEIDNTLIGGVKVKIGDKVIDGTVKGRLDSLRQYLNA
ncbi:MAG: synthase delta subunit [Clostridiales bacterium]|nr:synthase delta subunit [Clostridiales bacterium]